jgi:hypothetical protein
MPFSLRYTSLLEKKFARPRGLPEAHQKLPQPSLEEMSASLVSVWWMSYGAQVVELSSERHETIRYSKPSLIAAAMRCRGAGKNIASVLEPTCMVSFDVHKQPKLTQMVVEVVK